MSQGHRGHGFAALADAEVMVLWRLIVRLGLANELPRWC